MHLLVMIVSVITFALAAPGISGQQQPTFRASTRLIVQTVNVKDRDGKPIEGLTARDFVVTEDNEPQEVSFVEYQRLENTPDAPPPPVAAPVISGGVAPVTESRIAASPAGAIRYRDLRLLVLYFDLTALPPPDPGE